MPEDQQQDVERAFLTVVVSPILLNSCHLFLYGLYIFIFRSAISALRKRPQSAERRFHILSLNLLFILATVNVPIRLACDILFYKISFWEWEKLELPDRDYELWFKCRLLADAVMVFRLFVIWGYRKIYAVVPMAAFLLVDVLAGLCAAVSELQLEESNMLAIVANAALSANGGLNLILTALIAMRIWREAHKNKCFIEGKLSMKRTNTIIAIVLESGILYAITVVAYVITWFFPKSGFYVDLNGIMVQVAGIAPTLIVARAISRRTGGHAFRDSEENDVVVDINVVTPTREMRRP
ncbi:hypothetical protein L218DRAFT_950644 [Marasmius fiardii PR-910]|nr:hypothetical protein L218DRAFT_950644 [Marasmius fiardii PR-910]